MDDATLNWDDPPATASINLSLSCTLSRSCTLPPVPSPSRDHVSLAPTPSQTRVTLTPMRNPKQIAVRPLVKIVNSSLQTEACLNMISVLGNRSPHMKALRRLHMDPAAQ